MLIAFCLISGLIIPGCDDKSAAITGTVSSAVSGSVFVAVDQNNQVVQRAGANGTPKTFALSVPIGGTYRFYLFENEGTIYEKIFPLYQGTTNKFSIASKVTIDFGFVGTTTGVARPTNDALSVTGVTSAGEDKAIPEILIFTTPPTGASLASLVSSGLDLLGRSQVLKAKAYFKAAVDGYPGDTTNDGDTARFLYALTRVLGINLYIYSGSNAGTLQSIGDILDRQGCSPGGRNLIESKMVCSNDVATTFPTGTELQTFLLNVVKPELENAIVNLDSVSTSFNRTWKEPVSGKYYKSDFGDVLFFKAQVKTALASVLIQSTYNLSANIATDASSSSTAELFLMNNPDFLKLASGSGYSTTLQTAKTLLSSSADHLIAASNLIQLHTADYLLNFVNKTSQEVNDGKADINRLKDSLTGSATFSSVGFRSKTYTNVTIDMSPFFVGMPLRGLLPPITGNKGSGPFPDPTMGGIIIQGANLNEDLNSNGIPDILE